VLKLSAQLLRSETAVIYQKQDVGQKAPSVVAVVG